MIIAINGIFASQLDYNALTFISTAGITDSTQILALDYLVRELKLKSIWNKMFFIYPFIGATATTHRYNLINPAANLLTFSGTWTHSSTGAKPNGTNAFANTGYLLATSFASGAHLSYYSRTNVTDGTVETGMGAQSGGSVALTMRRTGNAASATMDVNSSQSYRAATGTVTDSRGLFIANNDLTTCGLYLNNTTVATNTTSGFASRATNPNIYIGARNVTGTAQGFTSKECAFASHGIGLTSTDLSNLYSIVQQFQTILSRQV